MGILPSQAFLYILHQHTHVAFSFESLTANRKIHMLTSFGDNKLNTNCILLVQAQHYTQ